MFNIDVHTRVYIAAEPLDFRKQINGLALAVQETLELNPFSAHLFVFRNRHGDKLKVLYWHHNGYVLLYKRLEEGRFVWPSTPAGETMCVTLRELHALIDGSDLSALPVIAPLHYERI